MRRNVWAEPLATDVRCVYCAEPLEVFGEMEYVSPRLYREFLWRHVGGKPTCRTTNRAQPIEFGYQNALMKVEAALASRRAAKYARASTLDDGEAL